MFCFIMEKYYGEWMLFCWYDNILGFDRLVEVFMLLSEEEVYNFVDVWFKKFFMFVFDLECFKSIMEFLILSYWN